MDEKKKSGNKSQKQQKKSYYSKGSNKSNQEYQTNSKTTNGKYDGSVSCGKNPVDWYISNDQLARDAASLPYNVMTGQVFDLKKSQTDSGAYGTSAFPGICKISFMTSVGYSESATSAINTASRSIYSWVRHQNSGHSNYEAPDLTIYIMGMMEVYAAYFEACRVYKIAMTYKLTNRYVPKAILDSLGVNATDIMNNLAQFRAGLNLVAAKISCMAVPNNFTTFYRHAMLLSNVFLDSDTDRGQYYVFNRSHYRVYDATGTTGGYLKTMAYKANLTHKDILDTLNTMMDAILSDEDMNIMSGDILKAYDMSSLYSIPNIEEEETISFVFDESVLSQIENAVCQFDELKEPAGATYTGLDISQKDGYILHTPTMAGKDNGTTATYWMIKMLNYYVVNSHIDNPDYKFNVEATRLMNIAVPNADKSQYKIYSGSELLTGIKYYYLSRSSDDDKIYLSSTDYTSNIFALSSDEAWPVRTDSVLFRCLIEECFDWHPFSYILDHGAFHEATAGNLNQLYPPAGDVKTYAVVDENVIKNLHDVVLLAQFRTKLLNQ